ncbi:Thiamin-phosphate pyrophosphorylase [hydrothermal vent metagenome]|uniref:thiamine phosphate synthase n=1 Tax=hydrothermal vent metagenome TaxID=652676 RepID=A0A3B1BPM1_9ZZZZ
MREPLPSIAKFSEVDLYPVTGRGLYDGRSDEDVIAQLARGGARIVQLREKSLTDKELYELAKIYREETSRRDIGLVINDRVDLALSVRADGVHLGQDDMPVYVARRILGDEAIIGASAHSVEDAIEAERGGATYVNIGPLYPTPTKPEARTIGLEPVKEALSMISVPVTVMGGITMDNIDEVLQTGVRHVGVVSALFAQGDIAAATRGFVEKIRRSGKNRI